MVAFSKLAGAPPPVTLLEFLSVKEKETQNVENDL